MLSPYPTHTKWAGCQPKTRPNSMFVCGAGGSTVPSQKNSAPPPSFYYEETEINERKALPFLPGDRLPSIRIAPARTLEEPQTRETPPGMGPRTGRRRPYLQGVYNCAGTEARRTGSATAREWGRRGRNAALGARRSKNLPSGHNSPTPYTTLQPLACTASVLTS